MRFENRFSFLFFNYSQLIEDGDNIKNNVNPSVIDSR